MGHIWNVEKATKQLPEGAYDAEFSADYPTTPHPTNAAKLAQVLQDAYWEDLDVAMDDLKVQSHPKTMTGGTLTQMAKFFRRDRRVGEDDTKLRIRFASRLQELLGPPTVPAILSFIEGVLGAAPGQVEIRENLVGGSLTGAYTPADFYIVFDFSLLDALGYSSSEYTSVIASLDESLDFLAAAGVRGSVLVTGGGEWDQAVWDGTTVDDVWGS